MDPKRAKRLIANRQVTHDVDVHHVAPGRLHETAIMALLLAALSLARGHWLFHQIAGRNISACKLSSHGAPGSLASRTGCTQAVH